MPKPSSPQITSFSAGAGISAVAASVAAALIFVLAFISYRMPAGYSMLSGAFSFGAVLWSEAFHFRLPAPLFAADFRSAVTIILTLSTLAYGVGVMAALRNKTAYTRNWIVAAGFVMLALAIIFPPVFSGDTAAYVTSGRIQAIYHLNPYLIIPHDLIVRGDSFLLGLIRPNHAPVIYWNHPMLYGPVWQLIGTVSAAITQSAAPGISMMGFKVISAASLLLMAFAAGAVAERIAPGTRLAAFIAIAFNPLFLIEGPGNGHNDFTCVAFILMAYLCLVQDRFPLSGLWLGLAAGVKLFPLALVPWFVWWIWRRSPGGLMRTAQFAACAILPIVIGYGMYWLGPETFRGFQTYETLRPQSHIPIYVSYIALSVWIAKSRQIGVIMTAWVIFSLVLSVQSTYCPFPWYMAWSLGPACIQFERPYIRLFGVLVVISALVQILMYTVPLK